jgi:CRP/FNR family transcriptional regulator
MDCTVAGGLACMPGEEEPDTSTGGARTERAADASLCLTCPVRAACVGSLAAQAGTRQLLQALGGWRRLRAGELAFRGGENPPRLYAVRSGSLKSVAFGVGGEAVRGLHIPGEIVGAGVLASGRAGTLVVALEPTELCALHWGPPSACTGRVWDMASRELLRERVHAGWLAGLPAAQRVAAFRSGLAPRLRAGGRSVPLSAADVASYLGVPQEMASSASTGAGSGP